MDRAEYLDKLHKSFALARTDIVDVVQPATGARVAASQRLIRGDENEVHRVELTDGSAVYLRASFPGTPLSKLRHEAWAMSHARAAGVPAPEVIATETVHSEDGDRTAMVMREATGRQLRELLPSLLPDDRRAVLANIGRVLATMHSISMPGAGRPDEYGVWADSETDHRHYLADCLTASERLGAAGVTPAEVTRVVEVLKNPSYTSMDNPVLCHNDVSPEHIFVNDDLQVVGLIDWGMWLAGPAESELAHLLRTNSASDFDAIMSGHGNSHKDAAVQDVMSWHSIARGTGEIDWLVRSGQTAELSGPVTALRNALAQIAPLG